LVLSDRKSFQSHDNTLAAYEYYPFGMLMQGYTSANYRYGFNGMEKDDEVKGSGNHTDFGARGYDNRLGRWWSVDPLAEKYPSMSPYVGIGNNPVLFVDKDGNEAILFVDIHGVGHTFIGVMNSDGIFVIYTYGQYGQGKDDDNSHPAGGGALIRLYGADAWHYLNDHYGDAHYNIKSFHLSDNKVDEKKIIKYFDAIIDDPNAVPAENKNDVKYALSLESKAVEYKTYTGIPLPMCTENCVTVADEGLEAGGSNIITTEWLPVRLYTQLSTQSILDKGLTNVSDKLKKDVEDAGPINVSDYKKAPEVVTE